MVQPTYPGVYVEEVSSGVRPITAASTSTAAFIGQAEKGPIDEATKIYNFTEFQDLFGDYRSGSFLVHAVFQFLNNGGGSCYIIRVADVATVVTSNIIIRDRNTGSLDVSLTIDANSPGVWGDAIELRVSGSTSDPGNEFKIEVYIQGEETPRETFDNLSMISTASNFVETMLSTSSYIRATVNSLNPNVANGTSQGNGAPAGLPPTAGETRLRISVDGSGYQEHDLKTAPAPASDLDTPQHVADAINAVVTGVNATISSGELLITSSTSSFSSAVNVAPPSDPTQDITGYLNIGKLRGGEEATGGAITRPQENPTSVLDPEYKYRVGLHTPTGGVTDRVESVNPGDDGMPVSSDQPYINALSNLDNIDDVSLIAIPGIGSDYLVSEAMSYCERRTLSDCFFIGDMAQDDDTVGEGRGFVTTISSKNSYGAVYIPWLLTPDPTGVSSSPIAVPPSGFVAGMYAKTDNNRGVWKAPAGIETALSGTSGIVTNFTDTQHGDLNVDPYNVNVIRQFKNAGRVIWGARTISSDPEWRYVPVRRMAIMLRVSLYRGTQWVVFEPNDEPLWAQIRLNVGAFMHGLFRQGAFQGKSPKEAYLVKCDSETTTQNDINQGIVNIIVGFAPLKPAEFVMIKIQQLAGQVEA